MLINDTVKNKKALEILCNRCERFDEVYKDLKANNKVRSETFSRLLIILVGSGYPEAALELVNDFVTEPEERDIYNADIQKYQDEDYKPCSCLKFDCSEEEIKNCQGKLTFNNGQGENRKVNNSCASFITSRKVIDACKVDLASEVIDEMLDEAINGNRSILLGEEAIEALSILNQKANTKYLKVIDELKEAKIPIGDLKKAVEKNSKEQTKADLNSITTPATEEDVCDVLKPFIPLFQSPTDYMSKNGAIYTLDKDGEVLVSNLFPLIIEKLIVDDGKESEVYYKVVPICNAKEEMEPIIMPALSFKSSSWVFKKLGNKAILYSSKNYDAVRRLAQIVAREVPEHKITGCMGWLNASSEEEVPDYSYCFSGGCIGETHAPVRVIEMQEIIGYKFSVEPPSIQECVKSYHMLESLVPDRKEVMLTLIAHSFSSILTHKLEQEGVMPKHLVWVYGCSGSFKTSVALVVLSLFGAMENPPCTFIDTVNSIEKKMSLVKDGLLLIDDFFPASTPSEANQKNSKASIVTRGIGDRIGKARSSSNMVLQREYRPRGNVLVTGEDCPTGFSTTSRHMSIPLNRGDVDVTILSQLQNSAHLLNGLMVHFILWVKVTIMDNPEYKLKPRIIEIRDKAQNSNHHKRFAMSVAHLQIAYEMLMQFFVENELITEEERNVKVECSYESFMRVAEEQNRLMQSEDVADKFMTALAEMISTSTIQPKNVDLPRTILTNNNICFDDDYFYYFIPGSTYSEVVRYYQLKNEPLLMTERMLWKMLDDKGYLLRQKSADTDKHVEYKIRKTIGEKSLRVIGIKKALLDTF